MKFAITPRGIGKKPGARAIQDAWELVGAETFSIPEGVYSPHLVLASGGLSLRAKTQGELNAETSVVVDKGIEQDRQAVLEAELLADATFTALAAATPVQITTLVATSFPGFSAPQQAVMALLLKTATLVLRRGRR